MSSVLGERRHDDRIVSLERFDGEAVVVKRYASTDPAPIFAAMRSLWCSPFGADRLPPGLPKPIALDAQAIVMEWVDGPVLGVRGSPGRTIEQLRPLAGLLADLHGSGVQVAHRRNPSKLLKSLARKRDRLDGPLAERFDHALSSVIERAPDEPFLVLSHGDFSPRNVISSTRGLVLIDFDRLQMAGRGRDPGYLGAWLWATEHLGGGEPAWQPADRFLHEYATAAAIPLPVLRETAAFYRAAGLLRIAQSWSSLAGQPEHASTIIAEAERLVLEGGR
jgi:aminoglycoside phosphotransferase (APT) family kinase protein